MLVRKYGASFLFMLMVLLLLGSTPGIVFADAAEIPQDVSLEQAVSMALKNSNELKQAKADLDAAKITKDEVWELNNAVLMQTYIPGTDLHVSIPTDQDPTGQVYATNFAWLAKQKNYEIQVDTVVNTVYQKYYNVLQALADVEAKNLAAQQSNQQLNITKARIQVGMDSPLNLNSVQAQAAAANSALETAKKNLDKAYSELNDLLGLPKDSRPKLTDAVTLNALNVNGDVESFINSIIDNSPPVWIAKENVRLVKQTWGMNEFSSYDLDEANLDKAQADLEITKNTMKQTARQLYYTAKSLEDNYQATLQQVKAAEEYARVTKLQYEVGLVTKAQVTAAEASLAAARSGLLALQCNHELMVKALYKPWAAGAIMSGMSGTRGTGSSTGSTNTTASGSGSSGAM